MTVDPVALAKRRLRLRSGIPHSATRAAIVPGGRSARGHDLSVVIRKDDIWLRDKAYSWETPAEEIRITPVRGRRLAIEQSRRRQQHRARTRRINGIARTIALAKPFL